MLKHVLTPFQYKRMIKREDIKGHAQLKGKKQRVSNWSKTLRRIWSYISVHKGALCLVIFMVIASTALSLLGPFLIGIAIDKYIVTKNEAGLFHLLIQLLGVYIGYSLTMFFQNYWMVNIAQNMVFTMRTELFNHLHALKISYFDKRQHGELMSRMTNDIEIVSSTLNNSVIQILSSVLTLIGALSVMLYLSPILTIITLITIPIMFLGLKWITNRTGKIFKEQQRHVGDLNGFIEETISGQKVVRTFSQEQRVIDQFLKKSESLKGTAFWAQTYTGFIPKLMNVLNNLSFAIIAGLGGVLALNGMITIGVIVVFTEYSRQFTRPMNELANQFNTLLSAVAGAERVFEVLDEEKEEIDEKGAKAIKVVKGKVEFKQVSFSYERETKTIHDLSFSVSPGETIALVGPTGAGKTTIINLLSRFYPISHGSILLDGVDLMNITRKSLRQHMGFVLQDSYLFSGTIRENIRYGNFDASDEEVVEAAKLVNAHSFIKKLPGQYDFMLSQGGDGISQGERQLLSIARAILTNPSILVLDEATSNIDTITEIKIQEALQKLMKGRTCFVIAHRLNTIQQADRILVLKEGRMIELGTHEELLNRKGFYYELLQSQFTGEEAAMG